MRRTGLLLAVVVTLVASVAGTAASAATRTRPPLRATDWVLTNRVSLGTPLGNVPVDAVFGKTSVGGHSGCNGYQRSYTTSGARMTIAEDGVSTLIACEGPEGAVENAYLTRLGQVRHFRVVGTTLTLSTSRGMRLLVYRASIGKRALAGGWSVTSFYTGTAISSPVAGSALTLEFADDRASGNSGCNTFDGPVKVSGVDGIALGPFRSTRRACGNPAVSTQEQQYLTALGLAKTYRVTGNQMTLFRGGGTIAATFDRARGLTSGS